MRRKSCGQALTKRRASPAERYRITGFSTRAKGLTFRQAVSDGTRPRWNARFSAAFSIVRERFAVALRLRRASSVSATARVARMGAFRFLRTPMGRGEGITPPYKPIGGEGFDKEVT